jgi:hypothetical protein
VIRRLGGHLGAEVSALIDGQMATDAAERAWDHVLRCSSCRAAVEREAWVKRRLGTLGGNEPSARLLGALQSLSGSEADDPRPVQAAQSWDSLVAWSAVDEIEHHSRARRRAGLAVAGAGSAAVLGFAALSSLGLGGAPAGSPAASITGSTPTAAPTATAPASVTVQRRLPGWLVGASESVLARGGDAAARQEPAGRGR